MTDTFRLLVSCTNRKRRDPLPGRLLRSVPRGPLRLRFEKWIEARDADPDDRSPAAELYVGDHWHTATQILEEAPNAAELWVLSAGYGLIRDETPISPYGATFTPGTPDSVSETTSRSDSQRWWELLTTNRAHTASPHSVSDLAKSASFSPMVVVASATYATACTNDLLEAGTILGDRLVVISIGGRDISDLKRHLVDLDARVEHAVGGTRTALNARTARALVRSLGTESISVSSMQLAADRLVKDLPSANVWNRRPHSDEEVLEWIRDRLAIDNLSRTRLLRDFRAEGNACEQRRFAGLYERVVT